MKRVPVRRQRHRKAASVGLPPGSLVRIGDVASGPAVITSYSYSYSGDSITRTTGLPEALAAINARQGVVWINVDGVHDADTVRQFGHRLELHPLTLEDVMDASQRPKIEEHDSYLFLSLKMLHHRAGAETAEDPLAGGASVEVDAL